MGTQLTGARVMWAVRVGLGVALLLILIAGNGRVFAAGQEQWCEASDSTRRAMQAVEKGGIEYTEPIRREILRGLEQLLAKNPDDLFLHIEYIETKQGDQSKEYEEAIERYRALLDKHPRNREYEFLYLMALVGTDTPQSIAGLKAIPTDGVLAPQVHLELADIYRWGKFADQTLARSELNAYLTACPGSLDAGVRNLALEMATPEALRKYGTQLRQRLQNEKDTDVLSAWGTVWKMEFAARLDQPDAVRASVRSDLQRLRQNVHSSDLGFLVAMRDGYRTVDDQASQKEFEDQILTKYPDSWNARQLDGNRFEARHPSIKESDSNEVKQAYYRASLEWADAELRKNPGSSQWLNSQFYALTELQGVSNDEVVSTAEQLRIALSNDQSGTYYLPPVQFQIASEYIKRNVRVEEVPTLVAEGDANFARRKERFVSDRMPDEDKKYDAVADTQNLLSKADLLVDAATALRRPEIAKNEVEKVSALKSDSKIVQRESWSVQAKWAELEGRKLDALLMYEASLDLRTVGYKPRGKDDVKEGYDRVWKELGGTAAGKDAWATAISGAKVEAEGGWERVAKDVPAADLVDYQGKKWNLSELKGKTVLVNVWATWCGWCIVEHPYLQALYDKVKDRKDIAIVTLSIDDSIGDVAPYMKEKKYTFPVLLASRYIDELKNPDEGVPQNWIVDADGKWMWKQVGFEPTGDWEKKMLEKLEGK